jgi:1,4-alpha-glucan branching enzyme
MGMRYKYHIESRYHKYTADRGDPLAFSWEVPPATASVISQPGFKWQDSSWMEERKAAVNLTAPLSIYEMHLGSWRQVPGNERRAPTYREMAPMLAGYLADMEFSHVEFLPVMEHPFFGSWGYQTTGYFAPTSRYGSPADLMYLIDYLHRNGIGVIWTGSLPFPADQHGPNFDGTHLYEHASSAGFHPDGKA